MHRPVLTTPGRGRRVVATASAAALLGALAAVGPTAGPIAASPAVAAPEPAADVTEPVKPRVIAMTDGEIDDWSTMVRFLLYSSDYDIAGIVEENSLFQQVGHSDESWLEDETDAYEAVYPNLVVHNPDYPTPDYLRSVSVVGNETKGDLVLAPEDMATQDTPGEQLIIDALVDDDPRPILFGAWGGANTLAQALWTIKTEHPAEDWDKAVAKTRIYAIWYQDNGGRFIEENFPEIQIFEAFRWDLAWNYRVLIGPAPDEVKAYMTTDWLYENVKSGHGPLGEFYPQEYVSEGDTPAFMGAVANGLQDGYADFTLGGWGGRGALDEPYLLPNHYTDRYNIADDGDAHKQYWRWLPAVQNDFEARADWMVTPAYEDANHQPEVVATGATTIVAQPGETFTMDLTASTDPDGDALSYDFWHYGDQDSVQADVAITQDGSGTASFVVPDEPGTQIQVIAEVTDDGAPALTTYQRYLVDIGTAYAPAAAERPADSIDWGTPTAIAGDADVSTTGTPVKAVALTDVAAPGATVAVNGVEFASSPYTGGTTTVAGGDTVFVTDSAPISGQLNRTLAGGTSQLGISSAQPFLSLSAGYQNLLRSGFYNDADESRAEVRLGNYSIPERYTERAGLDLTLTGLTPGQRYELQLFVSSDSTRRIGTAPMPDLTTIARDQGGETSLRHSATGVDGSAGQYVVGTFTASADTKVVQLIGGPGKGGSDGRSAVLNAYQLRAVDAPEPVTLSGLREDLAAAQASRAVRGPVSYLLTQHLDAATRLVVRGQDAAAVVQLERFVGRLDAPPAGSTIDPATGAELRRQATALIEEWS